ncbi:BMP family ABC transporter substrate-binding protein [Luedemannella helvata]|uniref:BMP family ABC transporter substrate-binding protein n=2 Tax=Luedemannella helvata TaxID=349315 RepID=A0ABN2JPW8_9ACTN
MRPVRGMRLVALVAVGGLTLAASACGEKPTENGSTAASPTGKAYTACMVTDQGGLDDKSFNASAWKGLENAKAKNPAIQIKNVQSKTEADYEPNLNGFVQQKCDFVLAVGGLMSTALEKVAKANPNQQFGIVDAGSTLPNVHTMQYRTEQAAFLAGYLAGGMTKSGKVATYGGMKIPPVTIFMDGYADGVAEYNKVKSKTVQVLGWNKAKQTGTFTEDFDAPDKGKAKSDAFVAQGADIILPVAGKTGTGTASAAKASGGKYSVIWVDQDGCVSNAENCPVFLTTIVKNVTDAVTDAVVKGAGGEDLKAPYVGTLANNGVSLAPFHDFEDKVPAELKAEIDKLKADIIAGTINVNSPAAPK